MAAIRPKSPKTGISPRFLSKIKTFILISLCFLVYLALVPIFVVLTSPLYLYRFVVILMAKLFRPDIVGIVCTRDGVVGLDDVTKKSECMLNLLLVYHGEPDIQQIRAVFQKRVLDVKSPTGQGYSYEKFKYYYESWLGYSFWKQEEDFRLEDHIRFCEETEAPQNNNNNNTNNNNNENNNNENNNNLKTHVTTEEEFLKTLGPISTRPFKPKTSPWELLIIRNYVPTPGKLHTDYVPTIRSEMDDEKVNPTGRKWALVLRVHHGISDGYSLMKMVLHNWSCVPLSEIPKSPKVEMSFFSTLFMYVGIIILSPYYHLRQFVLDVDVNFWHMSSSKLTRDWYTTMSEKISLAKLKEIGVGHGVSTTAVLLGGFAGAIRAFLKERGEEHRIPEVMRGMSPMPWKGHPMDSLVNHWTLGTMVMPVGEECIRKRLRAADHSIKLLKKSPILFTNFGTVPLLLGPPSWLTDIWATNWMTTMILSNFPGPNFVIKSFDDYYSVDSCFWLPQMRGSASMGVAFMSYNGGIRVNLTIDKAIIPDQAGSARLNELISEEIKNLHNSISSPLVTVG